MMLMMMLCLACLAQWAVGDLSGVRNVEDTQPYATLHTRFLAILFVKVN
jgi:hypothetical protein